MSMTYLVYEWRRPCGTPFYVGMGQGNRPWKRERGRWANSVRKSIEAAGEQIDIVVVGEYENQKDAFAEEMRLIALYGRLDLETGTLANMTDGGEGCQRVSPESRERMRQAKLGVPNPKLSESQKGRPATEAQKAVLLEQAKKPKSAEQKAKIAAAHRGKTMSVESRAKISASKKGTVISPEHREKIGAAHRGKKRPESWKKAISEGLKRRAQLNKPLDFGAGCLLPEHQELGCPATHEEIRGAFRRIICDQSTHIAVVIETEKAPF